MSYKIAVIGGGSVLWMPRLGADLLLEKSLQGSEMCLVDIDRKAALLTREYLEKMNNIASSKWKIHITTEDEALDGADCVVISISTGKFEAMEIDCTLPEKYGVYATVGDTVGPAGISRSLRNIPVFLAIAEKMTRLCPGATMVHVTNPLTQLTRAVNKSGLVKCVGLCHEFTAIMSMLQRYFKKDSITDLDGICMGVNHFTILTDLVVKGIKDPMRKLNIKDYLKFELAFQGSRTTGTVDDDVRKAVNEKVILRNYFNFKLFEELKIDAFPAAGPAHFCENFSFYNHNLDVLKSLYIERKKVIPDRVEGKKKRAEKLRSILENKETPPEIEKRSAECLADVVVGLCTGEPRKVIAALPNQGQISNLPEDAVVETWAVASRGGVTPLAAGKVPEPYRGFMQQIITEQELTVEAAMEGSKEKFIQALISSPEMYDKRPESAKTLAEEFLKAHKKYLPQFFKKQTKK